MGKIKKPSVAGLFYPADINELKDCLIDYFSFAENNIDKVLIDEIKKPKIIVSPHAGYVFSGKTAAFGYYLLSETDDAPKRVVLIGPSHQVYFKGAAFSDFEKWETPLGNLKAEAVPVAQLTGLEGHFFINDGIFDKEHSLEVHLPFLQKALKGFSVLPVLYSDITPDILLDIMTALDDGKTLFIVSSDLSHYLAYEEAKEMDALANEAIPALDFEKFKRGGEACGKTGILAAILFARKKNLKGALLNYLNSGDTAGDKDSVVGYGSYVFYV